MSENYYRHKKDIRDTNIGILVLIFFTITIIIWSIIVVIDPPSFRSGLRGLDRGKVFCASILFSAIILIFIIIMFSWMGEE